MQVLQLPLNYLADKPLLRQIGDTIVFTYIIVDDEPLIRKGTMKKLAALSDQIYCIGEAENGMEGLSLIKEKSPDIIITDMNMPVMDGTMFLPILAKEYPDKHMIVISGYKDFEYTKHAINARAVDYVLKPFSKADIIAAVERALLQIQSSAHVQHQIVSSETERENARYDYDIQTLKNSVLGYHTSEIKITSEKLKFINDNHNLVLMTLHTKEVLPQVQMQNFLSTNGFGDLALFLQHNNNPHLGFLILFMPQHSVLGVKELCTQVAHSIHSVFDSYHTGISFGISSSHDSLTQLHTAFTETVSALNGMPINELGNLNFSNTTESDATPILWDKSEELLFRIEAGMTEKVPILLTELFHYFSTLKNCTLYDVKCYCFSISDRLKLIMTEYFEQINPASINSSVQNILNTMFCLEEIQEYYTQFFINISQVLSANSVYATNDTIEKIKTYVERNYRNPLTIEFVSSLFYMNRSYCSHIFKERTGDTFVNYVNHVRILHAKELLQNTDKKMYQIAKAVGYDNVKYFFRIFKKTEQITPEQFRKL